MSDFIAGSPADPILADDEVLGLVRHHVPDAQTVQEVDESGHRARTYLVDDNLVLKTQRRSQIRPETSLAKEVLFLNHMRSDPRIQVPQVLGYGAEFGTEYTLLSRISGYAARRVPLDASERQRILRDFGRMLRRIHELPQAPLAESPEFQGVVRETDVKAAVELRAASLLARLGGRPPGWTLNSSPNDVLSILLAGFPTRAETVAIHANPGPQHTFVDPEHHVFTGLIDFGDARISHPAWDLVAWSGSSDQQEIFSGYTTDAAVSDEFTAVWRTLVALQLLQRSIRQEPVPPDDFPGWMLDL